MGHGHSPPHSHGVGFREHRHFHSRGHSRGDAPRAIIKAIGITLVFMIVELAGGWYANSLALVSDAAHMLTDVGAMLLSLFAIWVASKPVTSTMSFGYHRAEILGALASGLLIWLISGVLVYEAIVRLNSPPDVQGPIVFWVATIGLVANWVSMRMLHPAEHDNINVRAAYLHLLADSLGSVGAVIAGGILWMTGWRPIDPIVTLIFAAFMLLSSWNLVREAVGVLMESTPSGVDPHQIRDALAGLSNVREAHDLHIWSVSSGKLALSVHLISEDPTRALLTAANEMLKKTYGIAHTTIQIEHPDQFASERCYDCSPIEVKSVQ